MSNKELLAYLAGIIDGEGTIRIKKDIWRVGKDCRSPAYHEIISLKMTTPAPLNLMKQTFGGSLYKEKKIYQSVSGFKTNKLMWVYSCSDLSAANCCRSLLPYLLVKKKQAEICLLLRKNKESKEAKKRGSLGPVKGKGRPMLDKVLAFREDLWKQIKIIHRGASNG